MTVGGTVACAIGACFSPSNSDQLVVHDLDQLVARPDLLQCGEPDRLLLDPGKEVPGQIEADVGLEQNPPDLPEPFLDRLFRQNAAPGKPLERGVEFARKLVEHKPVRVAAERTFFKAGGLAGGQAAGGQAAGGQADRRTGGQADRRTGGQADRRTGGQADRRTGGQADRREHLIPSNARDLLSQFPNNVE